jgi:hypothetical protein
MISLAAHLAFGLGEAGNTHLGRGWSAPEPGFVWSVGPESVIRIALAPGSGKLVLELACEPFLNPPDIVDQDVELLINDTPIERRRLGGDWVWRVNVPPTFSGATEMCLALVRAPGAARLTGETRDLGVRLKTVIAVRDTESDPLPPLLPMRTIPLGWCEPPGLELMRGFGPPENGYVWAVGAESEFQVPLDGAGVAVLVLLDMRPFNDSETGMRQRIVIGADNKLIGFFELRAHLVLALRIEPKRGQRKITLHIRNLDAAHEVSGPLYHFGVAFAWALHSVRIIAAPPLCETGFMPPLAGTQASTLDQTVEARTGLPLAELVTHFESLGNCCELGILQLELLGREQPTLLRTSGIPQHDLVEGLARDFTLLGRPDTMEFFFRPEPDTTWRLTSGLYGLSNPTPYLRSTPVPGDAIPRASRAMAWLAAKFLRDQAEGRKIYILRLPVAASIEEAMLAVLAMLRRRSNAPILWLVADRSSEPGSVTRLPSGLLRGQLGPEAAGRGMNQDVLIGLLANAWMLHHAPR